MAKEKKTEIAENQQAAPAIEFINDVNVPIEVREEIVKKAEELKASTSCVKSSSLLLKAKRVMISLFISLICAVQASCISAST